MKQYQDKKVVIIGGTSGMGLATAKMLMDGGKDLGILLDLTSPERLIVRQALGLEEKEPDKPR